MGTRERIEIHYTNLLQKIKTSYTNFLERFDSEEGYFLPKESHAPLGYEVPPPPSGPVVDAVSDKPSKLEEKVEPLTLLGA